MEKNDFKLSTLNKNEQGLLKGGFKAFSANFSEPVYAAVTVSVSGNCGCKCEAEDDKMK